MSHLLLSGWMPGGGFLLYERTMLSRLSVAFRGNLAEVYCAFDVLAVETSTLLPGDYVLIIELTYS